MFSALIGLIPFSPRLTRKVADLEKKLDGLTSGGVIRAEGLQIVSKDGRVRARLGVGTADESDSVQLDLLDKEGFVQLRASVGRNQFFDKVKKVQVVEFNQPRIDLWIIGVNQTRFLSPDSRNPETLNWNKQDSIRPR